MSSAIVAVAKKTKNALTATSPNDFVFHSSYNTLKILQEGNLDFTIPANTGTLDYIYSHGMEQIPFAMAFMREAALAEAVFPNNQTDDPSAYLNFEGVIATPTQLKFRIGNTNSTTAIVAHIKYYIFEIPL